MSIASPAPSRNATTPISVVTRALTVRRAAGVGGTAEGAGVVVTVVVGWSAFSYQAGSYEGLSSEVLGGVEVVMP